MTTFLERFDRMRVNLPPVDAGRMKYFALVTMLIDHIAYCFLENVHTADNEAIMYSLPQGKLVDGLMRMIGRQAFPIFCFFLVEGFMKTRSRIRYFLRILFFAVLSQYPFQKAFFPRGKYFHANVMITLGIGFLAIWVIDEMRGVFLQKGRKESGEDPGADGSENGRDLLYTGLFFFVSCSTVYGLSQLAGWLRTDYSYGGVILIVLLYVLQNYRIPALFISWAWLSWYNKNELFSLPAFYLLACYNGQRGKQHKYLFYIFYPAHLLILYLVRRHFYGI